jgi:branched-chain amino acid transport system permease protein
LPSDAAAARHHLVAASHWRGWEIGFWLASLAAFALWPNRAPLFNEIAILALFALSLDLILGYAGLVTLGHAAFYGTGAYAAGLLTKFGWGDPLLGLAAAGTVAGALGFATSFLLLRGSDLSRLMVTLGIAMMLYELANKLDWLTGGADGLQGVEIGPLFGRFAFDLGGRTAYAYSLGVLFVLFICARALVHAPFGLSLRALRANRTRASAIGIPVARRLVAIYGLSAVYAGIAGALGAQTSQFVSLSVLDFQRSADVLLVLVLGGPGTLYGGLVGAIVFRAMQEFLAGLTPLFWQFWIGLLLVVVVLIGHGGVLRLAERLIERLGTLWRP